MQFEKAYEELLKGKKIRRKEWEHFTHLRLAGKEEVKTYKGEYTEFYQNSNILVSNGWIVLDGDGEQMPFIDALQELKLKKKITNIDWLEKGYDKFIFIDHNKLAMCTAIEFDFMPTYQCLLATDWEIMR